MPFHRFRSGEAILILLALSCATGAIAQAPQPAGAAAAGAEASTLPAIANLRPVLNQVNAAVSDLRIARWKAPADVRSSSEQDVASIQRDLNTTLPPLLDQVQAAPPSGPLAPSFAIFRNIDALYDVLLRVTEMATLTGSSSEASRLEDARGALEGARAQLGNSLLASVTAQDAQITQLRAQIAAVPKPPPPPPAKIVVNDGPDSRPVKHRKKKPAAPAPPTQ